MPHITHAAILNFAKITLPPSSNDMLVHKYAYKYCKSIYVLCKPGSLHAAERTLKVFKFCLYAKMKQKEKHQLISMVLSSKLPVESTLFF